SCAMVSTPSAQASGTLAISTARPRSAATITGRRGQRSTQTPAGSPTSSQAALAEAGSTPTAKVDAGSAPVATSGQATRVTAEPSSQMVCALHRSRKSRCRSTLAIRRGYLSGPRGPGSADPDHQRPTRAESNATAATPAVDVRSTDSPNRTGTAPDAAK